MSQKIPPPPQFTGPEWQAFNRWLLELTSILANDGGINPDQISGLPALFLQVAANSLDITALEAGQGSQGADITALQGDITTINGQLVTINGQITTLNARAQVLNGVGAPAAGLGNVNDWYGNITGGVGNRIYIKTAVGTWTAFPF